MTNRSFGVGLFVLAFAIARVAAGSEAPNGEDACRDLLTPSRILATKSACDGQKVEIRGFLRVGPEMRGLWDSKEDIQEGNYRKACVTVTYPRRQKAYGPVRLVRVYGTYRTQRPPDKVIVLGACSDSIIEIDKVVKTK